MKGVSRLSTRQTVMPNGSYIGINFGTTNTAVVELSGGKPMFWGENGSPFSSIVAMSEKGKEPRFGYEVKRDRGQLESEEGYVVFSSMKSYLGTDHKFRVGDDIFTATEITTKFLRYIKDKIRYDTAKIGVAVDITEAGFSFPVDFSPEARRELRKAAEAAGISVKSFISEPTAAYLACLENGQYPHLRGCSRVMVLDWGGGTFDISIVNLDKNSVSGRTFVREMAVVGDGDEKIGGDYIDKRLAEYFHAEILRKSKPKGAVLFENMDVNNRNKMIDRCEWVKRRISKYDVDQKLNLVNYGDYGDQSIDIKVKVFDEIIDQIIDEKILTYITKARRKAGLSRSDIDAVILVGGSSNLKSYRRAISKEFDEKRIVYPDGPEWSTAEGAALMQNIGGNVKLSKTLGVLLSDNGIIELFKANEHGVGTTVGPLNFSLVEDAQDAHFIFTNGGKDIIKRENVSTKGFLDEVIKLNAKITDDQIADITISSECMKDCPRHIEINELEFYYDISKLQSAGEGVQK